MSDKLQTIYNDPTDADIQIMLHSGSIIYAHSIILKANSPVLRAMLTGGWAESTSGQLRFTNSDAAVEYVVRYMYGIKMDTVTYKIIKFAHYLQMNYTIIHTIRDCEPATLTAMKPIHVIKIARLAEHTVFSVYDKCMRAVFTTTATGVDKLYDIASGLKPDLYNWTMQALTAYEFDYATHIITIFYGHRLGLQDLVHSAIDDIGADLPRAKLHMANLVGNRKLPIDYIDAIAAKFVLDERYVHSCGCNTYPTNMCSECNYIYCRACVRKSRILCIEPKHHMYTCPRCIFVVARLYHDRAMCAKCVEDVRDELVTYCHDCDDVTCKQHDTHSPETMTVAALYALILPYRKRRSLEHVIWTMWQDAERARVSKLEQSN